MGTGGGTGGGAGGGTGGACSSDVHKSKYSKLKNTDGEKFAVYPKCAKIYTSCRSRKILMQNNNCLVAKIAVDTAGHSEV